MKLTDKFKRIFGDRIGMAPTGFIEELIQAVKERDKEVINIQGIVNHKEKFMLDIVKQRMEETL
jgi:hypothetical protein